MNKLAGTILSAVLFGVLACGTPPSPNHGLAPGDSLSDDDQPTTAEWLFVTSEGGRAAAADPCGFVADWLVAEQTCAGEMCIHARDLGKDWLRMCEKKGARDAIAMKDLVRDFRRRARGTHDACVLEGRSLLRTQDCGGPLACERQAQRWISRCGNAYATPLVVLMLSRTLQRRLSDDPDGPDREIKFDVRTCETLIQEVESGRGCEGSACTKPVESATAWLTRCYEASVKMPTSSAFALADVLVRGGEGVQPMQIETRSPWPTAATFPLMTADKQGIIAWVCGEQPNNLQGYVKARSECGRGEVIAARVNEHNVLRTMAVPHADDATFTRWFPFLEIRGEHEVRAMAELDTFSRGIAQAADKSQGGHPDEAIALFIATLQKDPSIVRWDAFRKVLQDADRSLVPAFQAWGKRKVRALKTAHGAEEQGLYALRSLLNPLHDTERDGTVLAGSHIAAPWLTLDKWMPLAFIAYKDELSSLQRLANRRPPSRPPTDELNSEIRQCQQAEERIKEANGALLACVSADGCSKEKITSLASVADTHRESARRARENAARWLGGGLFSRSDVERYGRSLLEGRCGAEAMP